MNNYPLGATWKTVTENGSIATVHLYAQTKKHDLWIYNWCYQDHSAPLHRNNIYGSKDEAVSWCKANMKVYNAIHKNERVIFKRIL